MPRMRKSENMSYTAAPSDVLASSHNSYLHHQHLFSQLPPTATRQPQLPPTATPKPQLPPTATSKPQPPPTATPLPIPPTATSLPIPATPPTIPPLSPTPPIKLTQTFTPNDVLCGRGGSCRNHPGNIRFRKLISEAATSGKALDATRRKDTAVHIVEHIFSVWDPPGRFLKRDGPTKKEKEKDKQNAAGAAADNNNDLENGKDHSWDIMSKEHCVKKTTQALRDYQKDHCKKLSNGTLTAGKGNASDEVKEPKKSRNVNVKVKIPPPIKLKLSTRKVPIVSAVFSSPYNYVELLDDKNKHTTKTKMDQNLNQHDQAEEKEEEQEKEIPEKNITKEIPEEEQEKSFSDNTIKSELLTEYKELLQTLQNYSDKVLINCLTLFAEEYATSIPSAVSLYDCIRILLLSPTIPSPHILPLIYVIDSILKNIGKPFTNIIKLDAPHILPYIYHSLKSDQDRLKLRETLWTWESFALFPHHFLESLNKSLEEVALQNQPPDKPPHISRALKPLFPQPKPPVRKSPPDPAPTPISRKKPTLKRTAISPPPPEKKRFSLSPELTHDMNSTMSSLLQHRQSKLATTSACFLANFYARFEKFEMDVEMKLFEEWRWNIEGEIVDVDMEGREVINLT